MTGAVDNSLQPRLHPLLLHHNTDWDVLLQHSPQHLDQVRFAEIFFRRFRINQDQVLHCQATSQANNKVLKEKENVSPSLLNNVYLKFIFCIFVQI